MSWFQKRGRKPGALNRVWGMGSTNHLEFRCEHRESRRRRGWRSQTPPCTPCGWGLTPSGAAREQPALHDQMHEAAEPATVRL